MNRQSYYFRIRHRQCPPNKILCHRRTDGTWMIRWRLTGPVHVIDEIIDYEHAHAAVGVLLATIHSYAPSHLSD